MSTTIYTVGGGMFDLSDEENYNKVRRRLNEVAAGKHEDDPFTHLQFITEDDGRICLNPDKIIGLGSTLRTDAEGREDEEDEE